MKEEFDNNEEPAKNNQQTTSVNSKDYNLSDNTSKTHEECNRPTISEESNPLGCLPSGMKTPRLRNKRPLGGLQINIVNDNEDTKLPHIPDISNPLYDPRRYFSFKFRRSPPRNKQRAPDSEEKIKEELDPTKTYSCMDESARRDLSFSSRHPNYLGDDFKYIKYPPLENVNPPVFQPNRPPNPIIFEMDFTNFDPQFELPKKRQLHTSSSEEIKVIHLRDLDNDTESQSSLKGRLSEVQLSQFSSGSLYQESSELLSTTNETLKEKKSEPMVAHELNDINKIKRSDTLKTIYRTSKPLSWEEMSLKESKEYLKGLAKQDSDSNTELLKQPEFNSSPASEQKATANRGKKPPLIYEDFKEPLKGPKPQYWIDFKETGEIGKTVAIFDSRDFQFYNENIKPMWVDKDFDFNTPIPEEIHEFSKSFMSHIPFYDNENEEIQKFVEEYKALRSGPKYNIQVPPKKKRTTKIQKTKDTKKSKETKETVSATNLQKETAQNDPKHDSPASESKKTKETKETVSATNLQKETAQNDPKHDLPASESKKTKETKETVSATNLQKETAQNDRKHDSPASESKKTKETVSATNLQKETAQNDPKHDSPASESKKTKETKETVSATNLQKETAQNDTKHNSPASETKKTKETVSDTNSQKETAQNVPKNDSTASEAKKIKETKETVRDTNSQKETAQNDPKNDSSVSEAKKTKGTKETVSDTNSQKETAQNDPKNDSSASEAKKTKETKEIVSDTNSQKKTAQNDPKNDSSASEAKKTKETVSDTNLQKKTTENDSKNDSSASEAKKTKGTISDTNSQKETAQNDPKNDSSASETKISESQETVNTEQETTTVTEEKPAIEEETPVPKKLEVETYASKLKSAAPLKHPMSVPKIQPSSKLSPWDVSASTGDLSYRRRIYYRSEKTTQTRGKTPTQSVHSSPNKKGTVKEKNKPDNNLDVTRKTQSHTVLKKVTFKEDEKSGGNCNNSNASKKTQSLPLLPTPKKKLTLKENKKNEDTGKTTDVSEKTEIGTPILKVTKKKKRKSEKNANNSDVSNKAQSHTEICDSKQQAEKSDDKTKNATELKQQPIHSLEKSRKAKKSQIKTDLKQQANSTPEIINTNEPLTKNVQCQTGVIKKKKKKARGQTAASTTTSGDDWVPVKSRGKASRSDKAKMTQNSNSPEEMQPKKQKSKFGF